MQEHTLPSSTATSHYEIRNAWDAAREEIRVAIITAAPAVCLTGAALLQARLGNMEACGEYGFYALCAAGLPAMALTRVKGILSSIPMPK